MATALRDRVRRGDLVFGVFLKTASHQVLELVSMTGIDFAVVDAEHAPFDLLTLDRLAVSAKACGMPLLIRPPTLDAGFIGQVLDMSFDGVVAPHVDSAEGGERVLDAVRYDRGKRGFSPSTRAGGYGAADAKAYRARSDLETNVWCQIEDASALSQLDAIAALEAVDCLFIGRADLALSLGVDSQRDSAVHDAVRSIVETGVRHGRAVGIYVSSPDEIPSLRALGVSVFICGSDQSWLLAEGRRVRRAFDKGEGR